MFKNYSKISYDFDGVERTIVLFNNNYDFSDVSSSFYAEKIQDDELLDTFSLRVFDKSSTYHIPLYTSNTINPFIELPPTTEQIENEYTVFKSLMSPAANFTATGGQTLAYVEPGDLVVQFSPGSYSASFNTTNNFAYVAEVDYELNKLKVLNKGMTQSDGYRILRKTNNQWNPITSPLLTGFVLNDVYLENFSNSPVSFVNENGIMTNSFVTAGFTAGTPTGGYISMTELNDFIGDKNFVNIPTKSQLNVVGDMINVSS
jgi:hypothetical protein